MGKTGDYSVSPWVFEGNALYQLNLVRAEEARKYVPANLKMVELFGWTLGGMYLARYSGSPVGAFDELVVLGGLVWNGPTSCAWASRVYVDSKPARDHGIRTVGLPSRLASFSQGEEPPAPPPQTRWNRFMFGKRAPRKQSWWNVDYAKHGAGSTECPIVIRNEEKGALGLKGSVAELLLPEELTGWAGPRIKLGLPSFSGNTKVCPGLLEYECKLTTNVRMRSAIKVVGDYDGDDDEDVSKIVKGRPLVTMGFSSMHMAVEAPKPYLA